IIFLNFSLFFISNIYVLGFSFSYFLFYATFLQMGMLIGHLVFRVKGKEIPSRWYIPEIAFSIIFAIVGSKAGNDRIVFNRFVNIAGSLILFSTTALLVVGVYDNIKYYTKKRKDYQKIKKLILTLSVFITVIFLYSIIKWNFLQNNIFIKILASLIVLGFPFVFIFSTYGYSYIPQQLFFENFISLFYQILIVILIYFGFTYLTEFIFTENHINDAYVYLPYLFILFIIVFHYSLKNIISVKIKESTYKKNSKLRVTLEEMIQLISGPHSVRRSMNNIIKKVKDVLEVEKLLVLIPDEKYRVVKLDKVSYMMKMPVNSSVWEYFEKEKDATITSYLTYGSGIREQVYKFLTDSNIQLAYPIFGSENEKRPTSIFLLGKKKNQKNFSRGELSFIKECTRLGDMVLQNFLLLVSEIEKKRIDRDFEIAGLQDKTIHTLLDSITINNLEISHLSIPLMTVSGDYVDFKREEKSVTIFLGDVSGHGVGSGYLVSAIKALVNELLEHKVQLVKLFEILNEFLMKRHTGNQFMSLVGGEFNQETSEFEFVNAGHLYPILYRKTGEIEILKTPDRVLGVMPTVFQKSKVLLKKGDRLVIFSDGVTETFGPSEKIFGVDNLKKCIIEGKDLDSSELINKINSALEDHRKGTELTDDISIICLTKL
ncbi:MAG: SpoIIE family protein phosphatase, partial [Leptospiraceae bacterium]|nr:SpoIIE family protein phosphatase [Leptospiraceae bacterium]